ncbi:MAG TPA: hypothetical protein VFF16_15400, partial [Telluria sp.]|nr:hypothetical protein [Telluria sp.]
MATFTQNTSGNGGFIQGDATDENINVSTLAPAATSADSVDILANAGNDTITGHDGHNFIDAGDGNDVVNAAGGDDFIRASAGDDTVDGGAGDDVVEFLLDSVSSGTLTQEVDTNGHLLIKLDGTTVFTVTSAGGGSFLVTGATGTAGEVLGTESISGVEHLQFRTGGGSSAFVNLSTNVFHDPNGNGGWVGGSIMDDTINLATEFPNIVASTDGSWVQGAGTDPGAGNDTVTGTAGSDFIQASAG